MGVLSRPYGYQRKKLTCTEPITKNQNIHAGSTATEQNTSPPEAFLSSGGKKKGLIKDYSTVTTTSLVIYAPLISFKLAGMSSPSES